MGLDIRWPIGIMFSLVGLLLVIFGAATNSDPNMYAQTSLGININLIWGAVLLVFGVLMLLGAVFGRNKSSGSKSVKASNESPETVRPQR